MAAGFIFYMEVDERKKILKRNMEYFCVLQTSEYNRKCLTKIVAVYVKKLYNMT